MSVANSKMTLKQRNANEFDVETGLFNFAGE